MRQLPCLRVSFVLFAFLMSPAEASDAGARPAVKLEQPQAKWAPTLPTREDKKALEALANTIREAWAERHLDDVTNVMAFPVLMVTDDGSGNATSESWTRERYLRVVGEVMNRLPPNAPEPGIRRRYAFVTDALATIHEDKTRTVEGKKTAWRTTYVCARQNGRWVITAIIEGGWGDNP